MYNVLAYGKMIADGPRTDAYVTALRNTIGPNSVVIDLGSGPGLFALIACRLGARRVFAIEPDNIIQVGRDAARELGLSDRIEFIQNVSMKVTLPEQANVIVSDLHGILPFFKHHIPAIIDARSRLLAPGGVLIPSLDRLWAAVVEAPAQYSNLVSPWEGNGNGVVLSSARNLAVNIGGKIRVAPENLLGEPVCWHELDYHQVEEANVCEKFSLSIDRKGTAHGLAVWFDAELPGAGFSNTPGSAELIYGNAFFPFQQPLEVLQEDRIDVRLEAHLIGDDYTWRWDTTLLSPQGNAKCSFKQSTLFGVPLSASNLRKRAGSYVPEPNEEGAITGFVLSQMDGKNSNEQIAAQLLKHFSHRFRDHNDALDAVFEVSDKYCV